MQGRLVLDTDEKRSRAAKMGIADPSKIFDLSEMAKGDVIFAATGVTDGNFLKGVHFGKDLITTHSVVMRAATRTIRYVSGQHRLFEKFRNE
jgi:fructose-1,6-bisphosphatase II / sedoheptulose-1,7-bisphosphatase